MTQQFIIATAFAIGVLTATASAYETMPSTYDSTPTSGGSYTSSPSTYTAASPVEPIGADLGQAVASYDMSGELFGESRYQLQVA